jgi:glycyl-tRNA synthetase
MELEFFIKPDEVAHAKEGAPGEDVSTDSPEPNWGWKQWHQYWVEQRLSWYKSIGLPADALELHWQSDDELAHYARATVDIMYKFPFGVQELEGVAARSNYDLTQHQEHSGKSMEYFDEESKARYIPHVIEPSAGVDRMVLALICNAYHEAMIPNAKGVPEKRVVMRFDPKVAPIKVGVFPLLKNKPELVDKAKCVYDMLKVHVASFYDETGAIGKRYARQDEIGTPYCVTIDFDTLGEKAELLDTVTLRERDSTEQSRVPIKELLSILKAGLGLP